MQTFEKAVKYKSKLRCAIFGTSGSGKTYSSLAIASGISDKIALIDTEHGSASKYADKFSFDVCNLDNKNITSYIETIDMAANDGYEILIIDSLTHAWIELLDEVEKIAQTRFKGNTWSAWSQGTPKQRKLVDSLLTFPGHVIGTMRCKTEWTLQKDDRTGKVQPLRVGLSPEQGKGIEYEFDLLLNLSLNHSAEVIKDRTGVFQDEIIEKPGKEFGKKLMDWLNEGKTIKGTSPHVPDVNIEEFENLINSSTSVEELKNRYTNIMRQCVKTQDKELVLRFEKLKDIQKEKLENRETIVI